MKGESREYGGLDIAGIHAGAFRVALTISEARQGRLSGYRIEAGAYEYAPSEG
jgi:hypothetical protein